MVYSRDAFIENGAKASYFQWLTSKGTNYTCYLQYLEKTKNITEEAKINSILDTIRVVASTITQPFQFSFFYFTIVAFFLHKFNFRKPVVKIILYHYIFRSLGDVFSKWSSNYQYYFVTTIIRDENDNIKGFGCSDKIKIKEMAPLSWFFNSHLATIFWYIGEIVADWYPMLRTRAISKGKKSMWFVYITCAIFNLSKIVLIAYYLSLTPSDLYDEYGSFRDKKLGGFYNNYRIIQLSNILTSVMYDITVFYVLMKNLGKASNSDVSFIKKFRSISEYRLMLSLAICLLILPLFSVSLILNFYFQRKLGRFPGISFENIRTLIANIQYYMIFIDQILLLLSEHNINTLNLSKLNTTSNMNSANNTEYYNSNTLINHTNSLNKNSANDTMKDFELESNNTLYSSSSTKFFFKDINKSYNNNTYYNNNNVNTYYLK